MRTKLLAATLGVLAWTVPAFAQDYSRETADPTGGPAPEATTPGRPPQAYGTASTTYTVAANATVPLVSDTTYGFISAGLRRYRTGGSAWFQAPVTIPSGGLLTAYEVDMCDTDVAAEVFGFLHRCPIGGGNCTTIASMASGVAATPGCVTLSDTTISTPELDQENFQYSMEVGLSGTTVATSFGAMRLNWRRQISPAPAVATFPNDVPPTHGFFRFIEALAAAGVTGGCGAGAYCPDQPVTRGQMAVFLATALGLHFPN